MQTRYERYDVGAGTNERFTGAVVQLQDAGTWRGVRLEQWAGQDSELPETVLVGAHGIVVSLDGIPRSEVQWVGHRRIHEVFAPRTISIFPGRLPYRSVSRGNFSGLVLAVDDGLMASVASAFGVVDRIELKPAFSASDEFLRYAAQSLADDISAGYPVGPTYGEAIAASICAHLVRHHSTHKIKQPVVTTYGRLRQERIRTFVNDRIGEELKLSVLAEHVGMDVYAFSRWFKVSFGIPPHRYILQARIDRAKSLLVMTKEPLTNIALQCGFYSASHFSTVFRRMVGVTPSQFRAH